MTIWYDEPGTVFVEDGSNAWDRQTTLKTALVVGNGMLGAIVTGGAQREVIVLNEHTLWSGRPQDADNPKSLAALPEVRRLLFEGRYLEAERLCAEAMICKGVGFNGSAQASLREMPGMVGAGVGSAMVPFGSYQALGNLEILFDGAGQVEDYRRELDLGTGIARVEYRIGGARYVREVFASAPDGVLVVRLSCDQPFAFTAALTTDPPPRPELENCREAKTAAVGPDGLVLSGRMWNGEAVAGMRYMARMRVLAEGGNVSGTTAGVRVQGAGAATILVSAATDYRRVHPHYTGNPYEEASRAQLDAAVKKPFAALREAHVADHRGLFDRVRLDLGPSDPRLAGLPTDERLAAYRVGGADPELEATLFQMGRYVLIASSRPGSPPCNLQGIWVTGYQTPWADDYHLNINFQMQYWPAETTNLGECHQPLFDLVDALREPGRRTARMHYGARGWVVHHITNAWGYTAPDQDPHSGQCPVAGAWLCLHLWEHYAFGRNTAFLREKAWPIMREAAQFWLDCLVTDPKSGYLVSAPAVDFENGYLLPDGSNATICAGPDMGNDVLRELFTSCVQASRILGTDGDLARKLEAAAGRMPPKRVSPRTGKFQHWQEDWDFRYDNCGRASSLNVFAIGDQVSPRREADARLCRAARKTLEEMPEATNWTLGWMIMAWARLHDAEGAYDIVRRFLGSQEGPPRGGGVHPNLLTNEVCVTDGNGGSCAGMAEMLLQSQADVIELLPALPKAWAAGSVTGLRARGGFVVDMAWSGGRLREAAVRSEAGLPFTVRVGVPVKVTVKGEPISVEQLGDSVIRFRTRKGVSYGLGASPSTGSYLSAQASTGSSPGTGG